jgi:hypothetical protein
MSMPINTKVLLYQPIHHLHHHLIRHHLHHIHHHQHHHQLIIVLQYLYSLLQRPLVGKKHSPWYQVPGIMMVPAGGTCWWYLLLVWYWYQVLVPTSTRVVVVPYQQVPVQTRLNLRNQIEPVHMDVTDGIVEESNTTVKAETFNNHKHLKSIILPHS